MPISNFATLDQANRERLRFVGRWRLPPRECISEQDRLFFLEVDGIRFAVMALTAEDAMRVAEFLAWKERYGASC